MLVQNTVITFDWLLEKNPLFATYDEAYFDLQITAPDGTVTYLEGSTPWATIFTQPSDTVDGQITYDYTPTQLGVYTFILGTGVATNFTIVDNVLALIVEQDTTVPSKVILP